MCSKGSLCAAGYGGFVGLVVGLLVVFVLFMNSLTGPAAKEGSEAKTPRADFLLLVPETSYARLTDRDQTLARIAVVEARVGNLDEALAVVGKVQNVDGDLVRKEIVVDLIREKVERDKKPSDAVQKNLLKVIEQIKNPVVKGETLRILAAAQDSQDAKKTLKEASDLVAGQPSAPPEGRRLFHPLWLIWPVGLAFFGFLLVLACKPCCASCFGKCETPPEAGAVEPPAAP